MRHALSLTFFVLLCSAFSYAQQKVTGTITGADDGKPIAFATVTVKGFTQAVASSTDNGSYTITVPKGGTTLVFSFFGMKAKEVAINGQSIVNVQLENDAQTLDETIVVAYGTVKKDSYSGAASVMKAKQLEDVPVINFEQALAGNVSGLQIAQSSGLPGSFPEIRIRGVGSHNAGNEPLYVIDGIPAISGDLSTANTGTSAMNFINPNDIESITVLKDAAAAALYGSRASNGVILITTKKGKLGKAKITFRSDLSISNFAFNSYELCSDEETVTLHRETFTNTGVDDPNGTWKNPKNPFPTLEAWVDNQIEVFYPAKREGYGYVNWEDELFRTAVSQNYEVSASGGSESTKFFTSAAYSNNQGVTRGRFMKRISGTMNLDHKLNKYFGFGTIAQFSNTDQEGNQEGSGQYDNPWYVLKTVMTDRWPGFNPDGGLFTGFNGDSKPFYSTQQSNSNFRNPLINEQNQISNSGQTRVLLKPWAELNIVEGLKLRSMFSYDGLYVHDRFGWLPDHVYGKAYGNGFYTEKLHEYMKLVSSTTLNYSITIADKHNVSAMVGWEAEDQQNYHSIISKTNLVTPSIVSLELAQDIKDEPTAYNDRSTLLSGFSSLNYDYGAKYYFSATFRTDGSSRFAADKRWGNFYSLSGSWRIANELFMKSVRWINDLRIRVSYGTSGTLPSRWYDHMPLYGYGKYGDSGNSSAFYVGRPFNNDLTWEKNLSQNIAVDTRLFDRVNLSVDMYKKTTTDLLLDASTSGITGFSTYLRNVGEMQNKGVEININVDVVKKQDLLWSVGFNWTCNKNEITEMSYEGEQITSRPYIRTEGYSFYQYYSREYAGVDPQTGLAQFYKNSKNSDGTFDKTIVTDQSKASLVILDGKKGDPDGYGGITSNLKYKRLDVAVVFNYMYGHYVWDNGFDAIQTDGRLSVRPISKEQLSRWQNPGDITDVPRRTLTAVGGYYDSSRFLKKGDFFRLKNITISYSLPDKLVKKGGLASARVFAAATNLFAITDLYFDPEIANTGGFATWKVPPMRTFSLGIEISL